MKYVMTLNGDWLQAAAIVKLTIIKHDMRPYVQAQDSVGEKHLLEGLSNEETAQEWLEDLVAELDIKGRMHFIWTEKRDYVNAAQIKKFIFGKYYGQPSVEGIDFRGQKHLLRSFKNEFAAQDYLVELLKELED